MMQLDAVSMRYDQHGHAPVDALRDVDLTITRGEYVALLGPSGSGKSTLMHVLGCLATPTSGRYELDGVTVQGLDRNRLAALRNEKIGFVFQRFHLLPRQTALENVALPMRFAGVSPSERTDRARTLLELVGLGDRTHHRPSELSGGQQQRVAIARALANEPPILLADEPTGNLDSTAGAEIVELLEALHADGCTMVVVTHDEGLAERAGRRIRLLDGAIHADA